MKPIGHGQHNTCSPCLTNLHVLALHTLVLPFLRAILFKTDDVSLTILMLLPVAQLPLGFRESVRRVETLSVTATVASRWAHYVDYMPRGRRHTTSSHRRARPPHCGPKRSVRASERA